MVAVLVILDGVSEPLRDGEPTSLELARTPALDRLACERGGTLRRELERVWQRRRLTERAVAHLPETTPRRATAGAAA